MQKNKSIQIAPFRHLYPFESHYFDLNGLKYHYIDEGDGDPLIMLHGNPTWSFYYCELIKALSPKYRTVVPDHIGCGLSDKPGIDGYDFRLKSRVDDLDALLTHLKINQKITLILHDWGGMIGMAYALRYPDRIKRLVVMNTTAFLPPGGKPIPLRLSLIRNLKPFAELAVKGFNLFAQGAVYMATYKGLSKEVKAGLTAPYNSWNNRTATLKFVQDIPLKPTDHSYELVKRSDDNLNVFENLPMLLCWGEHDFVFDLDYLGEWERRFPRAEVHRFADAGHYILEDVPEKIVPLVKEFLLKYPI